MTKPKPLSTPAFNLRDVVAEVCDTHHEADPARLIGYIIDQIAPVDYEEALAQALRSYVVGYVTRQRGTAHTDDEPTEPAGKRGKGKPRMAGLSKFLYDREFSPARNGWILRAEVNAEDARAMAEKRIATAQQFRELAAWYESIVHSLKANGVDTVGDLPVMAQEALRTSRPS